MLNALVLATIIPVVTPQTKTLSAEGVITSSLKAYDAVKTFEQTAAGTIRDSKGTAHISFQKPGKLRVSGTTMFGTKYELLADGQFTFVYSANDWSQSENPMMGIASITGISANAGTLVPAALMKTKEFNPLKAMLQSKPTSVKGKLGKVDAYVVSGKVPYEATTWFDAKTFFVLKTESKLMGSSIVVLYDPPKVNQSIPASRFKK